MSAAMEPARLCVTIVTCALSCLAVGSCAGESPRSGASASGTSTGSISFAPRPPSSGPPVAESAGLDCTTSIGVLPPPPDFEVILDVVALPTAPGHAVVDAGPSGDSPPAPRLYAKEGLFVRAGSSFQILVPAQPGGVGIGWGGGPAIPARQLMASSCGSPGGSGWLNFAGGYWLDQPTCATLIVHAASREQVVRIAVGATCPAR